MSDINTLLHIDLDTLRSFPLLAGRVADHQTKRVMDRNTARLRRIAESTLVDGEYNMDAQSVDDVMDKVKKGVTEGWNTREVRIVSYYLMKVHDDEAAFSFALNLVNDHWKPLFFNGLVFYLMSEWHGVNTHLCRMVTRLLIQHLEAYEGSNRRYLTWKNRLNFFDANGPLRLASMMAAKGMTVFDAPLLLGFRRLNLSQAYYSDVILLYIKHNHIVEYAQIEEILACHNFDRTRKLLFAYLVEQTNEESDAIQRALLCRFANKHLGEISLAATWAPFTGATCEETERLKRAMQCVNMWFAEQIIETFFEICVQDKNRKVFWLSYVSCVTDFKIIGSSAVRALLQSDTRTADIFQSHFIQTRSRTSQTSALVLYIQHKVIVEFSDQGALYVYNQDHRIAKQIEQAGRTFPSTRELKQPEMQKLVENDDFYNTYNEEGRMSHSGHWLQRMKDWVRLKLQSDERQQHVSPQKDAEGFTHNVTYYTASIVMKNGMQFVASSIGLYLKVDAHKFWLIDVFSDEELPLGYFHLYGSETGWQRVVFEFAGNAMRRSLGRIRIYKSKTIFEDIDGRKKEILC